MQIAETVIEIIENMDKQSPKMRAIVQYKKEEIFKVCFQCIYMIYLYIPFLSMLTSVDLNSADFFWTVGFEAAFFFIKPLPRKLFLTNHSHSHSLNGPRTIVLKSISTLLQIHAIHKFLCGYNGESPVTDSKSQSVTGKTVVAVQPELSLSEAFSMLVPGDLDKWGS